ncbi:hypothetical protein Deipe_2790 [Deinococcus peraridilitoris DSM 19664]|uniref:SbsA Ig-like domain-containing protein n=1 Tax=Deinococcus peraridilitoris (strain DSM 19664 / LMG 22246 / CIP 109416 / KR-200) TaxID=937777 RepID=L0A497_DEIPD|nr:hypothetical protein Deipe_2790 [Deinococcus peraridilitoris DSM 19664]
MFKHTCLGVGLALSLAACSGGVGSPNASGPRITDVSEPKTTTNVLRDTSITANPSFPDKNNGVDPASLKGNSVRLYNTATGQEVPGTANTDGADSNITFSPDQSVLPEGLLAANTKYTFEVTNGVKDLKGNSFQNFKFTFTTGTESKTGPRVALFSQEVVLDDPRSSAVVGLLVSPDGTKLYGSTLDGQLYRWSIGTDGKLTNRVNINITTGGTSGSGLSNRPIIGMAFDPSNSGVLWVSNNDPLFNADRSPPKNFSGRISKITLNESDLNLSRLDDYVVGLPRSRRDHLTSSLAFKDGFLYVTQGSNSSTGALDPEWQREETLLSATVLKINPRYVGALNANGTAPIDVQTQASPDQPTKTGPFYAPANIYDASDPEAPVTIFADGVRNSFDLVWHSNKHLYMPTNGGAAGGSTPAGGGAPALNEVPNQNDYLFKTLTGGANEYFGHPVALRGHYILNGGNPTANVDPAEVVADKDGRQGYPVGVKPDPKWQKPAYDFGPNRSPNGAIEYTSTALNSALKGRLMVVEYSSGNDILVLRLDSSGNVISSGKIGDAAKPNLGAITFDDPIDIVQTPNGNLYVSELFPKVNGAPTARITLLKPASYLGN